MYRQDSLLLNTAPDGSFLIMAEKPKTRVGESFTHFVSLEVKCDPDHRDFIKQVEEYQSRTLSLFPEQEAKPAKLNTLHITVATLMLDKDSDELAYVSQRIADGVDQFKRVYSGEDGIRCSFQGVSAFRDIVFLDMSLGANAFKTFRDILLINGLHRFITDQAQNPHLTYMGKLDLNDTERDAMTKMMKDVKTSRITLDTLSLRERKIPGVAAKPPIREYGLWRE